jgi:SPP1 gp7 family putative phage head morphogenesis protein
MPKKNKSLPSKEFWEKREAYKLKQGLKDINKIEKELAKVYKEAMNEMVKEINNLFYKYATDNNLSYKEANRLLNSKEYKEFKYDLKTYMKLIAKTDNEELLLELNTLAMKSRITRLEEMLYQCDKYINEIYETTNNKLTEVYTSTIKDNYYQTIYDIHKSIGVGASFSYIDNDMIKEILAFPWSGRHYSENLWINRTNLKNALKQELTQMLIQGKDLRSTARALSNNTKPLAKKLETHYKNCVRLIHTEHSYFMGEATLRAYEELNVDRYQYSSALDHRTCGDCGKWDGKIIKLSDRKVGYNASPQHPMCRCTELTYVEDDYSTRFARDSEGKKIEVPSSMKYEEWKKIYKIK